MLYTPGGLLTCDGNLLRRLVEHICIETVDWSGAIQARRYTHIIDFGPGRDSGIGALTSRNVEGRGVQVSLWRLDMLNDAVGIICGIVGRPNGVHWSFRPSQSGHYGPRQQLGG